MVRRITYYSHDLRINIFRLCSSFYSYFFNIGIVVIAKKLESKAKNIAAAGDSNSSVPNLQVFSSADIEAATNKFSFENKLGEGGYGPVYKVNCCYYIFYTQAISRNMNLSIKQFQCHILLPNRIRDTTFFTIVNMIYCDLCIIKVVSFIDFISHIWSYEKCCVLAILLSAWVENVLKYLFG